MKSESPNDMSDTAKPEIFVSYQWADSKAHGAGNSIRVAPERVDREWITSVGDDVAFRMEGETGRKTQVVILNIIKLPIT